MQGRSGNQGNGGKKVCTLHHLAAYKTLLEKQHPRHNWYYSACKACLLPLHNCLQLYGPAFHNACSSHIYGFNIRDQPSLE